jgi:hypothetical protein
MKSTTRVTILLATILAISLLVGSRTTAQTSPVNWRLNPTLLTNTNAVDICTLPGGPACGKTIFVCYADLNSGSSPTTFTIADKQTPPVNFANAIAIAANTVYSPLINSGNYGLCRPFPGGLTIQAGNANVVSFVMYGY